MFRRPTGLRRLVVVALTLCSTLAGVALLDEAPAAAATQAVVDLPACETTILPGNDDGSSAAVALPFTLNFLGSTHSSLFVNNNGNVTFNAPLGTFVPFSLTASTPPIIAPMFGDVDTRVVVPGTSVSWGSADNAPEFGGHDVFCAQWNEVGYYSGHVDLLNTVQLLLVDRSDVAVGDFDIYFNYDTVLWENTDTSTVIGAGYASGNGQVNGFFELPCSLQDDACVDSSPTGLAATSSNSTVTGRHIFSMRSGGFVFTGAIQGTVTNAAGGAAVGGAFMQACGTVCRTGVTSSSGTYELSNLPDGVYTVSVSPPGGLSPASQSVTISGGTVVADFALTGPVPMPPGSGFGTGAPGTIPSTVVGRPTALSTTSCAGAVNPRYEIVQNGTVRASGALVEGPPSTYTAEFTPNFTGPITVRYLMTCGPTDVVTEFNAYIDPSGFVVDEGGDPIEGATVTLFRSDTEAGPFAAVPDGSVLMSPSNRTNPDLTDATGHFGWDVVAGYYYVEASADGCTEPDAESPTVRTVTYTIPPPVTDILLTLDCGGGGGGGETNDPPVVDAGADAGGVVGQAIAVTGTASDPDEGDTVTTAWSALAAPCTFANPAALSTTVTCTASGTYTLTLSATDGEAVVSDTASVLVLTIPTYLEPQYLVSIDIRIGWFHIQLRLGAVTAVLRAVPAQPLAGRTLEFTAGGRVLCTATTDANGRAGCGLLATAIAHLLGGYRVTYAGSDTHAGSTANMPVLRL